MTPTKPTEAEHELALRNARALMRPVADHAVPHDTIRVMLATALLDLHAKLAESERAREALREAVREYGWCGYCQGDYDGCGLCDKTGLASWSRAALAADQTTARESAETTAEETMTDTFALYCKKAPIEARPWRTGDDMARVSLSPADADSGSPKAGDMIARNPASPDDQWLIAANYFAENYKPAPAQPPEPVEPSDDELMSLYIAGPGRPHDALRAVYRAGRAAEAAAHAETKADAERQYIARSGVEHELERVRAELAEALAWQEADRLNREMHPNGRCECAGEGACLWCRSDAAQAEAKPAEPLRQLALVARAVEATGPLAAGEVVCVDDPQPGWFLDALTRRVERIERAMDSELAAYDMRIEREERERGA